ncbi:hypothetical protein VP01_225g1 [Puccinia sorghi]|uniref:Uncharacterized protein n=1 Tax=Puccinia sorghi TaxID=27349 RepID=A0A0L6V8C3_9BASI|nr:hypothetical protein VP01_225g1 [Puccinia sorghi]
MIHSICLDMGASIFTQSHENMTAKSFNMFMQMAMDYNILHGVGDNMTKGSSTNKNEVVVPPKNVEQMALDNTNAEELYNHNKSGAKNATICPSQLKANGEPELSDIHGGTGAPNRPKKIEK